MRLCLATLLISCTWAIAADVPSFPPPPRLATTTAELAAQRAAPDFPAVRERAVRAVAPLLKNPPVVPDGAGDWTFYYACPDDGSSLVALSPAEHQCPRCKKIYGDARTVAAYRTQQHDRANAAAEEYGWAWAYSSDETYARAAQKILLKLADDYPNYPKRHDRWGRTGFWARLGGRRYSQSLDEAVAIIKLAKAYDLTRSAPCWNDAQRRHVETDLFRETAETLLYANIDINNHQTWYNAGLMCIASVLGDEKLVEKVLTMRGGFRDQLARSVDRNGLWYEGTMAYQNYALQAMVEIVDAGRRMGLPLHREPKFRLLLAAPLQCTYPNGQFPVFNDSDPMGIASFDWSFRWAARVYDDWPGKPIPPVETKSVNLADTGLAILRRGAGDHAACAMLKYGPHGGSHGHFDKLNLVLFANGREWLLDPGRLTYSHKEYKTWVKETAAHNTVTLGGRTQLAAEGNLLWFDVTDQYAACAARCDSAYAGAVLTRYLLMTDEMLVDVFTVDCDGETQIDALTHAQSQSLQQPDAQGEGKPFTPGDRDGYQHLTSTRTWDITGGSRWDFAASKDLKLRVWLAGMPREQVMSTIGIGYTIDAKVPCLLRRVTGRHARFAAVYDLGGKGEYVTGVEADDKVAGGIVINTAGGKRVVEFSEKGVIVGTK